MLPEAFLARMQAQLGDEYEEYLQSLERPRAVALRHPGSGTVPVVIAEMLLLLLCYAGFCLLWGVNFWTDSFQEKSGIYAQPVTQEDLLAVTAYFADRLSAAADAPERDESGVFAVPVEEIFAAAPKVYDSVEQEFPFLEFEDPGVKPMFFSRLFSRMDFTGFFCSCLRSALS